MPLWAVVLLGFAPLGVFAAWYAWESLPYPGQKEADSVPLSDILGESTEEGQT